MTKHFMAPYTAQGDLSICSCDKIPADLREKQPENDGQHILAHSETGHHHVTDGNAVRVYEQDDFVSYLDVQKPAKVVHLRAYDRHETIELPAGKYRITRQREHTPEGFRRAAD